MIVGLTSDSISQEALRTLADRTIRPRLLSVKGVSQVAVIGGDVRGISDTPSIQTRCACIGGIPSPRRLMPSLKEFEQQRIGRCAV